MTVVKYYTVTPMYVACKILLIKNFVKYLFFLYVGTSIYVNAWKGYVYCGKKISVDY